MKKKIAALCACAILLVVGILTIASADTVGVALNAGDTASVTCGGPSLAWTPAGASSGTLACAPNPSTTTLPPTTTTTPATTTVIPPPPDFPTAATTGVPAGTALTVVNGDVVVTTAGDVVDAEDIRGCVEVRAPGVTVKRSKISCASFEAVAYFDTGSTPIKPLTIQDSEIDCRNATGRTAIGEANIVALRVNIHGCENGFDLNQHVVVRDSYIHDLANSGAAHTDGIQLAHYLQGSTEIDHSRDITIDHNTIYANAGTSAIISNPSGDVDVLVQNNLLAGGAYTLYCDYSGTGSNYRVLNNHFSRIFYPTVGAYGPWTGCENEAQASGNVYHETGLPVPF